MDTKIVAAVIALVVLGGAFYFGSEWWNSRGGGMQQIAQVEATEVFACAESKGLTAELSSGQVSVRLSDGRSFTLAQTLSASGVRYANEGDAVVFFTKGDDAFLEEAGVKTYVDCVQTSVTMPTEKSEDEKVVTGAPVAPKAPLSSYDQVGQLLLGKWRNEASQNQIFQISEDHSFDESYLTANGEFMVPKGTWRLEKTTGGEIVFDPAAPGSALIFVRRSEKGEDRRYEIRTLTSEKMELFDLTRQSIVTWLRIVPTP